MRARLHGEIGVVSALVPAVRTSTATSAAIDLTGYDSCEIVVHVGAWTDGTHTFSLTECATSGGSYTAVAAGDIVGTPPAPAASGDANKVTKFAYVGTKRFIKVVCTVTGSPSTGAATGATVVRGSARTHPVA